VSQIVFTAEFFLESVKARGENSTFILSPSYYLKSTKEKARRIGNIINNEETKLVISRFCKIAA